VFQIKVAVLRLKIVKIIKLIIITKSNKIIKVLKFHSLPPYINPTKL